MKEVVATLGRLEDIKEKPKVPRIHNSSPCSPYKYGKQPLHHHSTQGVSIRWFFAKTKPQTENSVLSFLIPNPVPKFWFGFWIFAVHFSVFSVVGYPKFKLVLC